MLSIQSYIQFNTKKNKSAPYRHLIERVWYGPAHLIPREIEETNVLELADRRRNRPLDVRLPNGECIHRHSEFTNTLRNRAGDGVTIKYEVRKRRQEAVALWNGAADVVGAHRKFVHRARKCLRQRAADFVVFSS